MGHRPRPWTPSDPRRTARPRVRLSYVRGSRDGGRRPADEGTGVSQPNKRTRKRAANEHRQRISVMREYITQGADYIERAGWSPERFGTVLMCSKLLRDWAYHRTKSGQA